MPYFRSLSKEYFCPAAPENLHTTTAEEQASKTAANCDEKKLVLKIVLKILAAAPPTTPTHLSRVLHISMDTQPLHGTDFKLQLNNLLRSQTLPGFHPG